MYLWSDMLPCSYTNFSFLCRLDKFTTYYQTILLNFIEDVLGAVMVHNIYYGRTDFPVCTCVIGIYELVATYQTG
jgi:hypothetical protein